MVKDMGNWDDRTGSFRFNQIAFGIRFQGKGNSVVGTGAAVPYSANYWRYHYGAVMADYQYYTGQPPGVGRRGPQTDTMWALTFDKSREDWASSTGLVKERIPRPTLRDPAHADGTFVIIKVMAAGFCGSDRGIWWRRPSAT